MVPDTQDGSTQTSLSNMFVPSKLLDRVASQQIDGHLSSVGHLLSQQSAYATFDGDDDCYADG